MATEDFFADSYRQARARFVAAAGAARLSVQTHAHPLPGIEGEALAMDIVRAGPFDARAVLLVSSACHGVEGYCGSGVQNALLADAALLAQAQAAGVALVLVHALNPHGFSHGRRVTHEGVDLNRNWHDFGTVLPRNPGYEALAHLVLPPTWPPGPEVQAGLDAYAATHGPRTLQQAITGGQYTHPEGLFYGGVAPTWSQLTLRRVLRQHGSTCARLAWIDLHTGLGPCGHGERILAAPADAAARARAWWGSDGGTVTAMHDGSTSASQLSGLMWQGALQECPQAEYTGIALEYGTVPLDQTLQALRADHWFAAHPEAPAEARAAARHAMREAFFVDTPTWKQQVVDQGLAAVRLAISGLNAAHPARPAR